MSSLITFRPSHGTGFMNGSYLSELLSRRHMFSSDRRSPLELRGLCEGNGVAFVDGESTVDVRFLLALVVVQRGLQGEGVGRVHVWSQVHPL